MTLPIMLMIPRRSCLRRAEKMWLFGGFGQPVPELPEATARTPLLSRRARRGEQHLCTRIANVVPMCSNSKKGRKSFSGGTWRELNTRRGRDCGDGE